MLDTWKSNGKKKKWLTYKNIGQRTCHIDGSGSSEDFSFFGSWGKYWSLWNTFHALSRHLSSLQVVARPLFCFLLSGQWGQEFLILCCGNAAASAATHWQFHDSSSLPFIGTASGCPLGVGKKNQIIDRCFQKSAISSAIDLSWIQKCNFWKDFSVH